MSMIKKGTCLDKVIISKSILKCHKCGHQDILTGDIDSIINCPKCDNQMILSSYSSAEKTEEN